MINSKNVLRIVSIFIITILFSACSSSTKGLGTPKSNVTKTQTTSNSLQKPIDAMIISSNEAFKIAKDILTSIYPDAEMKTNALTSEIALHNRSFWAGDALAHFKLNLVYSEEKKLSGIIYDTKSKGVGANFSMAPGYVTDAFFKELQKVIKEKNIRVETFSKYKITKDKSISKYIPASVPSSFVGFKSYLDQKNKKKFEGIWEDADGFYTLGILYDPKDKRYKYKAFVIESKHDNWDQGQVKANFLNLRENKFSIAKWFMQDKTEINFTCQPDLEFIRCVSKVANGETNLIKVYPTKSDSSDFANGVGTGWAITSDGVFVTNAHVVDGANEIFVGFKENNPLRARVLMIDKRIDLALLKVDNSNYTPIPLDSNKASNGSEITVIGYPLAFTLGDDPRVTKGVVSAQSGYEKDVTRYQISATIQPGNSGGPVINENGKAVGIVVEKLNNPTYEAVNFAIKSSYLKSILEQLDIKYNTSSSNKTLNSNDIFKNYKSSILPIWTKN